MKWAVPLFLFGFLCALIIFGFNTPFLPHFQITYNIPSAWPEFLTAIGTILATIIALSVALWGETLKKLFYMSNMKLVDYHENLQTSRNDVTQGHTRLKFLNDGGSVAEDVIVYVNEILEGGSPRQDFLPVPLSWTHDGHYMRNFAPHEIWYLDLCRKNNIEDGNKPVLVLAAGQQVPTYEDINEGKTILKIRLSQKSGEIRDYQIDLFWKFENHYVQIKNINEIT